MNFQALVDKLAGISRTEPSVVTLTLDVSDSGILPPPTRIFLKDHVLHHPGLRDIADRVRDYVESLLDPGADGLFLAAGPGLWEPVEMQVSLPNFLHVDRAPYLPPLLEAIDRSPRVLVARCGERRAMLEILDLGRWSEAGRWTPFAVDRDAERLLSGRTAAGRATVSHARAGIGGGKRDRYEQSLEAETGHLVESLAARVSALHAEAPAAAVCLFGDRELFGEFRSRLPAALRDGAEFLGPVPRREEELRGKVERSLEKRVADRRALQVLEFHERRAQGHLVALGPGEVLAHRTDGKLSRVFLAPENPVMGSRCVSCSALHAGRGGSCGYCGGAAAPVSLTQEIASQARTHPPLGLTFVRGPAKWLEDLGGMAGLLSAKGIRVRR